MPHLLHLLLTSLPRAAADFLWQSTQPVTSLLWVSVHAGPLDLQSSADTIMKAGTGGPPRRHNIPNFLHTKHLVLCAEITDNLFRPPSCEPLKGKDKSLACRCSDTQRGACTKQALKSLRVIGREQGGADSAARAPLGAPPGPPGCSYSPAAGLGPQTQT